MSTKSKTTIDLNDNIHAGHRKRTQKAFLNGNCSTLYDHQLLELFLMCPIRVHDVNPRAHKLIRACDSLYGVFHSDAERLMTVEGIGNKTANAIIKAGALLDYIAEGPKIHPPHFHNSEEMDIFCAQCTHMSDAELFGIFLDEQIALIGMEPLDSADVGLKLRQLLSRGGHIVSLCCHTSMESITSDMMDSWEKLYDRLHACQFSIMEFTIIEDVSEDEHTKTVNLYRPITSMRNMTKRNILELALKQVKPTRVTFTKFSI